MQKVRNLFAECEQIANLCNTIQKDMKSEMFRELDEAFFNDGYNLALNSLKEGITKETIISLVKNTYDYIDMFVDQFLEECNRSNSNVDCKKGCAHCCHQSVFVLPQEAFFLLKHIETSKSKEAGKKLISNIIEKDKKTAPMKVREFLGLTDPCPFLENNVCSVYEARPVACRLFQSMSVSSCIEERLYPLNMKKFARLYELPLRAGRMLNEGICAYLQEKGLKPIEWIIESTVQKINDDNKIIDTWLSGKDVFGRHNLSDEETEFLKKFDRSF